MLTWSCPRPIYFLPASQLIGSIMYTLLIITTQKRYVISSMTNHQTYLIYHAYQKQYGLSYLDPDYVFITTMYLVSLVTCLLPCHSIMGKWYQKTGHRLNYHVHVPTRVWASGCQLNWIMQTWCIIVSMLMFYNACVEFFINICKMTKCAIS